MSAHPECYGRMFPDLAQMTYNTPATGRVFTVLLQSSGMFAQARAIDIDREAWDGCQQCSAYRACYDLCMAQLALGQAIAAR